MLYKEKTPADKMPLDKSPVKITREDKIQAFFWLKVYCIDSQVS